MALQPFDNRGGVLIAPYYNHPFSTNSASNTSLDAAGESLAAIGYIQLSTGPGTSKVISAAGGGKIHWRPSTTTFNNASSNLRIGIQDVGATGLEDGSYDVQADLVGGTDTITASVVNSATMESGTKTIADGDLIAVVIELTARGGADSVQVSRTGIASSMPYCTVDSGSGPAKVNALPIVTIEFDDGTVGWFSIDSFAWIQEVSANLSTSTTPDEVALIFRLPFKAGARSGLLNLGNLAATDDFEGILYSDPLGTPVAQRTITQDMDLAATGAGWERVFATEYTLEPNTDYALALRPTTTNGLTYNRINFNTGNGNLRKATYLGTNWSLGTRSDQTGAFTTDATILPLFGVRVSQLDDGVSAGGGGLLRHPGMLGGLNA